MAFRIHRGVWQFKKADGAYESKYKLNESGQLVETDAEGNEIGGMTASVAWTSVSGRPTTLSSFTNDLGNYGGWLTTGGKAADSNLLDGIDSGSFLRSDASDDLYGTLTVHSGGANSYGRIRGYGNDNHFIVIRGSVSTGTSTLTITGAHRTTFVEHAEANDTTGWYFVSKQTGSYTEVARITRVGITAPGYNNSNWDTAYGWGNHSTRGYLTSESDTLATVTGRGSTTSSRIYADNGVHVRGDWVRVNGSQGIYFESYGGGWNMTDSSWIRAYNNKNIYTGGKLEVGGSLRADSGIHDANVRFMIPGAAYSVNNPSGTAGAIKIEMPTNVNNNNTMMSMTVQVYEYSTGNSFTLRCGGYNYGNGEWYNVFAAMLSDSGKGGDVPVYFGNDGSRNIIWIGNSDWSWSYPNVFVTDFQAGHTQNENWKSGWRITFDTGARTNVSASRTAYRQIDRGNIGSQSVNYATTAGSAPANGGNADTVDGWHRDDLRAWGNLTGVPSTFTPSSHTHDDRYYTESEVDSLLAGKAASSHSHSYLPLGGGTLTGQLNMHAGAYEGSIVFGSTSTWRTGIRQHDDADAELRIWAKNANGMIFLATGYDGEPANISRPTDGLAIQGNKLGIGDFSAGDPSYKLHVKGTGYFSDTLTLTNISGAAQTVPNTYGAYLHLGTWGDGRTAAGAVLVNTAYRADYATSLFDMNISRFTNNSGYITANGATGANGNFYIDDNYGYGIVGAYSSTRYQGVFAMGDSYKLPADGSGTGTLYGIAWTHTNVGGESKSGLGHQALFMMNGRTYTAIGSGIWTDGTITTTSHGNSSQWNTAYGWGNHASAGYASSSHNHSGVYLPIGGKAADSELLDGLDSSAYMRDDGWNSSPGQDANTQSNMKSDFTYSNNAPHTGDLIRFGAGGYSLQLNASYQSSNDLSFRTYNNDSAKTWNPWRTIIHSGNIGSQSVSYAATSGSTGNADTTDGLHVHGGRNNEANKIVRTDGNGYIQAGWINTTSGATTSTLTKIYASADDYLRYVTPAEFRRQITDGVYQAAGSYAAASHSHAISDVTGLQGALDGKQAAGSYAASDHNHTYNVNNAWLRENGDNANVKLYGNSRQMVFRTDGTSEYASGVGAYPFAWMYGGDAASQRVMLVNTSGQLWLSNYGWLHDYFQRAGSYAASSHTHTPSQVGLGNVSNAAQVTTSYNSSLNSDSRNSRGVTRLYRRDSDSDYSVQTYWTGARWRLYGYQGDSNHADTHVGYADSAGSASSASSASSATTATNVNNGNTYTSGNNLYIKNSGTNHYRIHHNGSDGVFDVHNRFSTRNISNIWSATQTEWNGYMAFFWLDIDPWGDNWGVGSRPTSWKTVNRGSFLTFGFEDWSDRRSKSAIIEIDNAVDKVKAIGGYTYWKVGSEVREAGVIAQDVLEVFPEAIGGTEEGYSVKPAALIGLLSKAVKEQQEMIDALTARIEALENK